MLKDRTKKKNTKKIKSEVWVCLCVFAVKQLCGQTWRFGFWLGSSEGFSF